MDGAKCLMRKSPTSLCRFPSLPIAWLPNSILEASGFWWDMLAAWGSNHSESQSSTVQQHNKTAVGPLLYWNIPHGFHCTGFFPTAAGYCRILPPVCRFYPATVLMTLTIIQSHLQWFCLGTYNPIRRHCSHCETPHSFWKCLCCPLDLLPVSHFYRWISLCSWSKGILSQSLCSFALGSTPMITMSTEPISLRCSSYPQCIAMELVPCIVGDGNPSFWDLRRLFRCVCPKDTNVSGLGQGTLRVVWSSTHRCRVAWSSSYLKQPQE